MKFLETIGVVYRSGAGNNHASSSLCDTSSSSSHSSPLPSSSVATGELNHFNSSAFHSSPSVRTLLPSHQNATPQSGHNNPLPVMSHGPSQLIIVPMQQLDRLGRIVQTLDQFRCKSTLTASWTVLEQRIAWTVQLNAIPVLIVFSPTFQFIEVLIIIICTKFIDLFVDRCCLVVASALSVVTGSQAHITLAVCFHIFKLIFLPRLFSWLFIHH